MEKVLQPVPASACVVYLYDILVHAATYTTTLNNQGLVFQHIAKANLCLNLAKCSLFSEVRSFLGLASYYQRFIVGFVDIAHPLHQLTEKAQQFQWSPSSQDAFDQLRRALTTAPVLVIPDPSKPFILDTNASNNIVRAVLSQVGEHGERAVADYS
ncbi:hypothetical protein AAFF_G00367120 [Aldrovandia affinis]|uniref:Reverse transcriptase/retrotransposon-derived protein RNase H-like domain-containing protein n=1 Tax=Aldrovandia affinis TaxID=143900 RepID=A0AAD7WNL1_9TELE|nr:hypothetical protein AAFF_G00367120 [Aldrovandia affinis]